MKGLLLALLISSSLFLLLYRFDNKYTNTATQAADGLLVLSEADLKEHPIRYLSGGWAFYPGVLLSPEDTASDMSERYMVYTMLGERTRFDLGNTNLHGSASYLMHMRLPKGPKVYALELPEIFSAYRLYVNGEILLTVGNPERDAYTARTVSRVVTFETADKTDILFAVSDYSHFYSGMVYPPAFGRPDAVDTARMLRLWLRVIILSVAIIGALLALYLGLRMKHQNTLLFVLLSLAMCGYTSYPLIHAALTLPVFPWYVIELCSGYLITLLVIVLHNQLCDTERITRNISIVTASAVCAIALMYGLSSAYLTVPVMDAFSYLILVYKASVAAYLLVTAFLAYKTRGGKAWPLLCATLFYAVAFAWDRMLPSYEPIYGGWFMEIGSVVLVVSMGYTLWRDLVDAYTNSLVIAEEHRQVSRQLSMQLEYSTQLTERAEENRRLIHDFRQHLRAIDGLAQDSGDQPVREYLGRVAQLTENTGFTIHISFCQNPAVDALLGYYYSAAKKMNIDMLVRLVLLDELKLTDVELCSVLGNLLENALEACERQTDGNRIIRISSMDNGSSFFLLVENSYDGIVNKRGDQFLSRKSEPTRIGIGLGSVRQILERYGGTLDIFPDEMMFNVGVCIPCSTVQTMRGPTAQYIHTARQNASHSVSD